MSSIEPVVIRWRAYFDDDVAPAHLVRTRALGGLIAGIALVVLALAVLIYGLTTSFDLPSVVIVVIFGGLGVLAVVSSLLTVRSIQPKPSTSSGTQPEIAFTVTDQVSFADGVSWPVSHTQWRLSVGVLVLSRATYPDRRFQVAQLQLPLAEVTAALEQAGVHHR